MVPGGVNIFLTEVPGDAANPSANAYHEDVLKDHNLGA